MGKHRRYFVFTIRLPLLLFAVVSICCAMLENQARTTRRCVAKLEKWKAGVRFDFETGPNGKAGLWYVLFSPMGKEYAGSVVWVRLQGQEVTDEVLDYVTPLTKVKEILIYNTSISDEKLRSLTACHALRSLSLYGHDVSHTTLTAFGSLRQLSELGISRSTLSREAIKAISVLPSLRMLSLKQTNVDDDDIAQICTNIHIDYLNLDHTAITSAAIGHIRKLAKLEWLCIAGTGVTDEAIDILCEFKSLREMHMKDSCVSEDGIKRMQKNVNVGDLFDPF